MSGATAGRPVWVTGIGAITAAGVGPDELRQALVAGRTAVKASEELGGACVGASPALAVDPTTRRLDRCAALFVGAARRAWSDAGLADADFDRGRCAVVEGSSLGPMADLLAAHSARLADASGSPIRPSAIVRFMPGAGGAAFAQAQGLSGPVFHLSCGSVSATAALGEAFEWIASGRVDIAVAGGAECPLHPEILAHFAAAGVLSPSNGRAYPCRPFAADRDGTVLGEGAGVLILEAADHARQRGVEPRALIRGYGLCAEAHSMTGPDPEGHGVVMAVRQAMASADGERIGWVKAHGTASRVNDLAECRGLVTVFGSELRGIPLTALKPYLGHCLGASGAVEAVAATLALEGGFIPAVLGTERPDPELPPCEINLETRESSARAILLLSESFGGRCAALRMAAA